MNKGEGVQQKTGWMYRYLNLVQEKDSKKNSP